MTTMIRIPLSQRELEVATIAAQGYSTKYIADRFSLSTRTVEKHLEHIYQKLEIKNRDQLINKGKYEGFNHG